MSVAKPIPLMSPMGNSFVMSAMGNSRLAFIPKVTVYQAMVGGNGFYWGSGAPYPTYSAVLAGVRAAFARIDINSANPILDYPTRTWHHVGMVTSTIDLWTIEYYDDGTGPQWHGSEWWMASNYSSGFTSSNYSWLNTIGYAGTLGVCSGLFAQSAGGTYAGGTMTRIVWPPGLFNSRCSGTIVYPTNTLTRTVASCTQVPVGQGRVFPVAGMGACTPTDPTTIPGTGYSFDGEYQWLASPCADA